MGTSSMTEGRQEKPAERPESSLQGWQSPDNQWLTLEQVAELTGLADRTIRHNCKHGKYQTKLINANGGEQYRILASSLPEAAYQKWCQEQLARIGYQTASRMPALRPENQADMWSTDKQRLTADARKGVAALVERTMAMTGLTQQAAIASILEQAAKGQLDTHTMKLLSCARDPRGKAGLQVDGYLLPSPRSLLRMLSQAKQVLTGDNSTLIPKVPQPSRQIPAWAKAFLAAYQVPAKPSVAAAYEVFKQEWLSQHPLGTLPSVHQVRRFLDKLGKVDKETGRKLPRELKAMKAFVRRDTSNLLPTDVYSIDGHTFDAEVEHPFHGRPFRPEITTVIDVATRMVVGISAGLKEGWMSVLSALRHGVTMETENIDTQVDAVTADNTPWCTTMTVHISNPVTGEYCGTRDEHVVPGTGLPPECHEDAPPEVTAQRVAVWRDEEWKVLPDWRGAALWSTSTGTPLQIDTIGVTPADVGATDIERADPTTAWDGTGWAPDTTLIEQQMATQRAEQNAALKAQLAELDTRSVRALHEALLELVAAGVSLSPGTVSRLQALEEQKAVFRTQLLPE